MSQVEPTQTPTLEPIGMTDTPSVSPNPPPTIPTTPLVDTAAPTAGIPTPTPVGADLRPAAPMFAGTFMDGNEHRLADTVGTPTLLMCWAPWSPHCQRQLPAVQGFHEEFGGTKANIVGVAISAPEPEVRALIDRQSLSFPIAYDPAGQLANAYEVTGVPFYIFIDKSGRVAHTIPGAPGDVNAIKERISDLRAE